jgi:hypothetical protein
LALGGGQTTPKDYRVGFSHPKKVTRKKKILKRNYRVGPWSHRAKREWPATSIFLFFKIFVYLFFLKKKRKEKKN